MEDPIAERFNYIVKSKSHDSIRGACNNLRVFGHVMSARPESPMETREPSSSKDLSRVLTEGCLQPTYKTVASSPIPTTKKEKLVLPRPVPNDESVVLNEKYEVIGTKLSPERKPSKKKLSKKRWQYLSFKKGENVNKGHEDLQGAAGRDESRSKKAHSLLRARSRSRSRSRSRGRGTSPTKFMRKDPKSKTTSTTRRHLSHSPVRARKPARMYDSSSVGRSIDSKSSSPRRSRTNGARDAKKDSSSRPTSRHSKSAAVKGIHAKDSMPSSDVDEASVFPFQGKPSNKMHDHTSTKPVSKSERSSGIQLSCNVGMPLDNVRWTGTTTRPKMIKTTGAVDQSRGFIPIRQPSKPIAMSSPRDTPSPSTGSPFCGSRKTVVESPLKSQSWSNDPVDRRHIASTDQTAMEKVTPLNSDNMDDELLKPEHIKIHSPDDFPTKTWNKGTIASLVRAANVNNGEGISVASSVAQSVDESHSPPSPASSVQRFSGSTENVARALGPFQSCMTMGTEEPKKSPQVVKFTEPVSVESQSVKSSSKVDDSTAGSTTIKPPRHPHRGRVQEGQREEVGESLSVMSFDTQGTQQSTASRNNISKSIKSAFKGLFSKKQSKEKDQATQQTEDSESQGQNTDYRLSKEKRSIRKIESYVMESIDFLEEAAGFIGEDATEVEIFIAKAFAYANEAEKLATILSSSATMWEDEKKDEQTIRSVPSASSCTSTTGTSLMSHLDRHERLRRLEGLSFSDFGQTGIQSILCHAGGTIPFEQTRNLALETIQILESLSQTIHFSSEIEESIQSATSATSKQQWSTYGDKSLGSKLICGKNEAGAMDGNLLTVSHKRSGLLPPRPHQVPLEADDSTVGYTPSVVRDDESSSFMAKWSRKRRNAKSNKAMDDLSTAATDNMSLSNTVSTQNPSVISQVNDNDTSHGSYTAGTSVHEASTAGQADTISVASSSSLSVVKDVLELLAQEYCDHLCGGPPSEDI